MSNAAFVLIAVAVIVVVSVLLWLVNRKPQTFMSSIDDFEREMKALGGEAGSDRSSGHGRRRNITPSERRPSVDPSHVEAPRVDELSSLVGFGPVAGSACLRG